MIELRWRAVPLLIPIGIAALLPALVIWVAALVGSVGLASPLDACVHPQPADRSPRAHRKL